MNRLKTMLLTLTIFVGLVVLWLLYWWIPSETDTFPTDGIILSQYARILAYRELDVTTEWQTVTFLQPLNNDFPTRFMIEIKDWREWKGIYLPNNTVIYKSSQGEDVVIEVKLIDETGEIYTLAPRYLHGGFEFQLGTMSDSGKTVEYIDTINFTKMRVRSTKPFRCIRIIWQLERTF